MTGDARNASDLADDESITVRIENELYIAEDEETGISSQGQNEEAALENLAAALETYREGSAEPDDDGWL
ncbi:type II toxin-antitoxin system HicB family antitoxin [Halostagnicola bangensis]